MSIQLWVQRDETATHPELVVRFDEQMQLWQVVRAGFLARLVKDTLVGDRGTGRVDELGNGQRSQVTGWPPCGQEQKSRRTWTMVSLLVTFHLAF